MKLLWASLLALTACATPREAPRLSSAPPSSTLSASVRARVAARMHGHRADMTGLLWSVLFLDAAGVAEIASGVVETRRAEPDPELPAAMITLELEATGRLRALAERARAGADAAEIARAYGELMETCVRCHQAFLYGPEG